MARNSTFTPLIDEEKLQKYLEDLKARQKELTDELSTIELEMEAAKAYVQIRQGKGYQPSTQSAPQPRAPSTGRAPRGARGEYSTKVVELLGQHPSGLVSKQIAAALPDVKGLANLLTKMKSEGTIKQDARLGPYYLPSEAA